MSNMWNIKGNRNLFSLDEFKSSNLFVFDGHFEDLTFKSEEEIEILFDKNKILLII